MGTTHQLFESSFHLRYAQSLFDDSFCRFVTKRGRSTTGPFHALLLQANLEGLDPLLGQLRCLFSFNLRFLVGRLDLTRALSLGCR